MAHHSTACAAFQHFFDCITAGHNYDDTKEEHYKRQIYIVNAINTIDCLHLAYVGYV